MELISGALVAALTLGIAAAAFSIVAVVVVARRARREPDTINSRELASKQRIGTALVRLDDAIRDARDELAFAAAQFGTDETRGFATVLHAAEADAREAFELQQRLEDEIPDSTVQRRDWGSRIIRLSEQATKSLEAQAQQFRARRRDEWTAPQQLERLRVAIAEQRARTADGTVARSTVAESDFNENPAAASAAAEYTLADATRGADIVATMLERTPTPPVGTTLEGAWGALAKARTLLDARDAAIQHRADAAARLRDEAEAARQTLDQARHLRDQHEDPAQRNAINAAIEELLTELQRTGSPQDPGADTLDPVAGLARLLRARDRLDLATASALSAEQRLAQARAALVGALRQAEAQIAAASGVITAHRARVGATARTRLAEAQQQLALARDEADPVAALDAARRANSRAQDAEALARYDAR